MSKRLAALIAAAILPALTSALLVQACAARPAQTAPAGHWHRPGACRALAYRGRKRR